PADVRGVSGCGRRPFPRWVVVRLIVDVHTPKANVQYTTLDRKPLKSVRNRHQTNTILNTSHEPKSTTVLELKYRSYEMFTIIQEFTEKYRGFRGSLFSIHPLSGCERLRGKHAHSPRPTSACSSIPTTRRGRRSRISSSAELSLASSPKGKPSTAASPTISSPRSPRGNSSRNPPVTSVSLQRPEVKNTGSRSASSGDEATIPGQNHGSRDQVHVQSTRRPSNDSSQHVTR